MSTMFWLENIRIALVVTIIYLLNMMMQLKTDKHIEQHFKKVEREMLILHHRLEKLVKGENEK
jgi:hypothetical protein